MMIGGGSAMTNKDWDRIKSLVYTVLRFESAPMTSYEVYDLLDRKYPPNMVEQALSELNAEKKINGKWRHGGAAYTYLVVK
jgi:hypothetical protein